MQSWQKQEIKNKCFCQQNYIFGFHIHENGFLHVKAEYIVLLTKTFVFDFCFLSRLQLCLSFWWYYSLLILKIIFKNFFLNCWKHFLSKNLDILKTTIRTTNSNKNMQSKTKQHKYRTLYDFQKRNNVIKNKRSNKRIYKFWL